MEKTKHIVILAAGDFPSHPAPLQALRQADTVICCDSAYDEWKVQQAKLNEQKPFIVIGDGDSLSEHDKQELGDRWFLVDEQDYNDLHKAMAYATAHYPMPTAHYTILGATGRREDHTLGNISYLVTFAEEYPGADIRMITDHGTFLAMRGSHTFDAFPRQQISIFTPDPATAVTSRGLRWQLEEMHPRMWWQATLNEALENTFTLTSDGWVILFRTHTPKG